MASTLTARFGATATRSLTGCPLGRALIRAPTGCPLGLEGLPPTAQYHPVRDLMRDRDDDAGLRGHAVGLDEELILAIGQARGHDDVDLEEADAHQSGELHGGVGGAQGCGDGSSLTGV